MKQGFEGSVLEKVKKTFQKMTFGLEEDSSKHHLVLMNVPPVMARRDAAYERAVHLMRESLFSYSEEGRAKIYKAIIELLETSIYCTREIVSALIPSGEQDDKEAGPMLQYLVLLNDTVKAAASLLSHEMILFKDERQLTDFMGSEISSQFRSTDEIFSNSEMNIYHCVCELIDIAEPAIMRFRDYKRKTFSKSNISRYNKALKEFNKLYESVGEIEETPETN